MTFFLLAVCKDAYTYTTIIVFGTHHGIPLVVLVCKIPLPVEQIV